MWPRIVFRDDGRRWFYTRVKRGRAPESLCRLKPPTLSHGVEFLFVFVICPFVFSFIICAFVKKKEVNKLYGSVSTTTDRGSPGLQTMTPSNEESFNLQQGW